MASWVVSSEQGWKKGPWTPEEDKLLTEYVSRYGEGRWSCVARSSGLNRSGKSCRLRWVNYLRPGLKRGHITPQEEGIIIELHALWGNKWSTIARYLPGRTDNEIKNYWRTHFKKPSDRQEKKKKHMSQKEQHIEEEAQNDGSPMKVDPMTNGSIFDPPSNTRESSTIPYPEWITSCSTCCFNKILHPLLILLLLMIIFGEACGTWTYNICFSLRLL